MKTTNCTSSTTSLSFRIDNKDFDALKKKSKDYYLLIKSRKAQFPSNSRFLKHDFNLTDDQLKKVFILPHNVAFEPYVKVFQYKILNSILYTNSKLYKIGHTAVDKCSFCESEPERLPHYFLLPLCVLPAFLETVWIPLLFFNKGIRSPYSARRIDRYNNL